MLELQNNIKLPKLNKDALNFPKKMYEHWIDLDLNIRKTMNFENLPVFF